ncbi:hypothetical protein F5887DRAFT_1084098 [Amanita rubescens]|nr:hypothetical protein F5887DRAFT_1084098 [Amanita rubescens]
MLHRLSVPHILSITVLCLISLVGGLVLPGADTPLFYLVSSNAHSTHFNLRPLRIGTGNLATLTGSGPIGKFYFIQGQFLAADPSGSSNNYTPFISGSPIGVGCTSFGRLEFVQGKSSNKCAQYQSFQIQSDTENSQLGAQLVFNFIGGFFACNGDIWYKFDASLGPPGCTPVNLWTVPV